MAPLPRRMFRGIRLVVIGIVLIALAWNYSAHVPVLRETNSPWIPLAISPDGETLAVADSNLNEEWWTHKPGGPIRLLQTIDLTPAGPLVETPTFEGLGGNSFYPPLDTVEFSPDGKLLAVLQNGDRQDDDRLELLLIRLPSGKVWKSFSVQHDRWNKRGGIARRLFSNDGRLLAWHERSSFSREEVRTVRVWDVTEGRERFAVDGATHPVLSPDGKILAAVQGIACRLFDTQTGKVIRSLSLPGDAAAAQQWSEFSADGQLIAVNRASSGEGSCVTVFVVKTGKTVFEAAERSPYFIDGPTLVTVKGDSVLFRDTDTWEVQARASFSLGHYGDGSPIPPEPHPLPGSGAVLVYEPNRRNLLGRLGRALRLNVGTGDRLSWIDADSRTTKQFTVDGVRFMRAVVAPGGKRLVAKGFPDSDITVWELPPSRSWMPTAVVAGLLACLCVGWTVVRQRIAARFRTMSSRTLEKGSS